MRKGDVRKIIFGVRSNPDRLTNRRVLWGSLVLGSILSLVAAYSIARIWLIVGSSEGHSYYSYVLFFNVRSLAIWLVTSLAVGALLALPDRVLQRHEWLVVAAWIVAAIPLQGLLRSLTLFSFEQIFSSDGANSFYSVTRHYNVAAVLSDFDRLRNEWPLHAHSNMPGKLVLVYALELISERPIVLAWLVVAVSNLGGVLLYVFVKDLFADRVAALYSLALYLFVPSKLYFFPLLNTVTPVAALCCVWLFVRWLKAGSAGYAALLGVALYGLAFFEPLAFAIGLLLAALAVRSLWRAEIAWQTLLWQSAIVIVACGAVHGSVRLWFHFDVFHALREVTVGATGFNDRYDRPYWIWVRANPLEFLFGVGVCQALVFWVALGESLGGTDSWRERLTRPMATLGLALAATLLVIDLIGVNRGEVIRLWIFLSCFFQIPAACLCARLQSRTAMMLVLSTTLLQDVIGTSMIGFIVT